MLNLLKLPMLAAAMAVVFSAHAQQPVYELTEPQPNSSLISLDGEHVSLFGVMPGMKMEDVEMAIAEHDFLLLADDEYNSNRFYLYNMVEGERSQCLAYFIWEGQSPGLERIVMYEPVAAYLRIKDAEKLFSPDAINPQSLVYQEFLGQPDYSEITLQVESIKLRNVSYFYTSKNVELIRQDYDQDVEFMLVLHDQK